ncbi:MAG: type II secretion system F family protein, partial [Archangium sp.]|nr:type II secretion system F family protein [Archangium sp.]
MASAERPRSTLQERLSRAWYRHPVVSFVRHRKVFSFYQQLHQLIRAGVPLPTGFAQLKQYAPDDAMATGLTRVAAAVQSGSTLGDAMRSNAALFDDANVELLAFAEEAGRLEPVAAALLKHLEHVQAQRWKAVLGALWPLYLVGAAVFVGPLLEASQQVTSATTSIGGLYASNLVRSLLAFGSILGAVLGGPFFIAALDVEVQWDRFKRRVPLFGAPMRQLAASRFV